MIGERNASLEMVRVVARRLGTLRERVAFLGGAVIPLHITDPGSPHPRATRDVDGIVAIITRAEYYKLEEALRQLGFKQAVDKEHPMCRWSIEDVIVDIMPTDVKVLGFSNRWYPEAIQYAKTLKVDEDIEIRLVTAPYFLATKIEAFIGRGRRDYQCSHDIEDIITVIDGRPELIGEINASPPELKDYICEKFNSFLKDDDFLVSVSGHMPPDSANQTRTPIVLDRINVLAGRNRTANAT